MNAGQAMAAVLVDEFVRGGVRLAFVAPGSRSTPLALALAGDGRIATQVLVDERSAGFCALGAAKASGVPAVVVCTSGTATANLFPAVVEADQSRTPLLVLTADRPPELRARGANQTIDQLKLYGGTVRWFAEVGVAEDPAASNAYWRSTACRAAAAARGWAGAGGPAGPVHLNLAFREPLIGEGAAVPGGRPGGEPWTAVSAGPRPLAGADLERLLGEIAACERGVLVAGSGPGVGWPGGLAEPALALAQAAGWPLIADPLSGARVSGAVSTAEALVRHAPFAREAPDLVVRLGGLGTSKALATWLGEAPRQVVIDADGAWVDPDRSAGWLLAADPAVAAAQLAAGLPGREPSAWAQRWRRAEALARSAIDDLLDRQPLSEPAVAREVAALCPAGGTLVAASSMPVRDLELCMAPRSGLRVVANRGASGIDGFVSTALGAALASGGPTVALAGDLSMLHDQNGLLLSRSQRVDAVFVVINNDGGGIFSFLPQAEQLAGSSADFERLFGTPHGVSFEAVAGVYGCGYRRVERAGDLEAGVNGGLAAGGVHLVEVRTDRSANVAVHRELWAAVAAALNTVLGSGVRERF